MPNISFNAQQKKTIRKLLWILFPLFILISAVNLLSHLFPEIKEFDNIGDSISTYLWDGISIILCLVFSLVLLGFIFSEIRKNKKRKLFDKVIVQMSHPRLPILIVLIMCLLMSFIMNCILFQPDFITPDLDLTDISFSKKIIFGFFYLSAHFLVIEFLFV